MPTANQWVSQIRAQLKGGASVEHAAGVQWFFKEEVRSHGWYTAPLRRFANSARKEVLKDGGEPLLMDIADKMFSGGYLEERNVGVFLLEKSAPSYGNAEFLRLEKWLARIISWADHDALLHCILSVMVAERPELVPNVFRWAKNEHRWHRRAACVALIRGTRKKMFRKEIERLTKMLLQDPDDMVQKGLGWLLRETAKADPKGTLPFLMSIREKAPRLVLRTACEKLPATMRLQVLK